MNANQSSFTLLLRALWKRACFHLFPILHWFASLLVINSLKEKREREEKGLYRVVANEARDDDRDAQVSLGRRHVEVRLNNRCPRFCLMCFVMVRLVIWGK